MFVQLVLHWYQDAYSFISHMKFFYFVNYDICPFPTGIICISYSIITFYFHFSHGCSHIKNNTHPIIFPFRFIMFYDPQNISFSESNKCTLPLPSTLLFQRRRSFGKMSKVHVYGSSPCLIKWFSCIINVIKWTFL